MPYLMYFLSTHDIMSKRRTKAKSTASAMIEAAEPPQTDEITALQVFGWCVAALSPLLLGYVMYFVEASGIEQSRLTSPTAVTGEFFQAECTVNRKKTRAYGYPDYMRVMYVFSAPAGPSYYAAGASIPRSEQPHKTFTAYRDDSYNSWVECEAALSVVRAAKAPHPVWYELNHPYTSRTSLHEPDSPRFLWVGLAGLPLAAYAWLLIILRHRQQWAQILQEQLGQAPAPDASTPAQGDRTFVALLRWRLAFIKFGQRSSVQKAFLYGIFVVMILGFAGQFFWHPYKEQAGKDRLRAVSGR